MCGITGIAHVDPAMVDRDVLGRMTTRIAHRGPDGQGIYIDPTRLLGFGHRRLSILDLTEAASQPMVRSVGRDRHVLTYNGEIYNYREVRRALERQGETFTSTGDTEVLMAALTCWGTDALKRIEGMFAFAYWDATRQTLILARDRYGKKPLYVAPCGPAGRDGLVFGSELRAVLAHPVIREGCQVDHIALGQYLLHEFIPAPRTIMSNVRKVRAGECLIWRPGHPIERRTYYIPPLNHDPRKASLDPEQLASEFLKRVTRATADRLVADVPVGVFLSGGLDSSLIAACAVRAHPKVRTFSVGFDNPSYDESEHALSVAKHLGTDHHVDHITTSSLISRVPSLFDWMDEPFADSSLLPTTMVAQLARQHVTVALGGDGGDEILGGYPTLVLESWAGNWMLPNFVAQLGMRMVEKLPSSDDNFSTAFKIRQFLQGSSERGGRRHAEWLAPFESSSIGRVLTTPPTQNELFEATEFATLGISHHFDIATAYYLRMYLGEGVLTKVDRATMRHSLEARAPLLDPRVVEFCLSLPPEFRVRGMTTKWLMRKALRGLVPDAIIDRPKKGFGAPVGAWMRGPLATMVRDVLAPDAIRRAGFFDPTVVTTLVNEHLNGTADHRKKLYTLLVFEQWRRRCLA